ncbi:hypothetical protein EAH89_00315 [Roseomonas nepalensis]|uniref:Uncharacterized protein n=1 Tax=Muricoccus nepalensis TaxID=1854500 RepID=A0A502GG02_9PROT|nr:hypothetical protein [Roseomonas nepalensis]TPG61049.1 hypothetical protein EAH89_00315 [Roseomonas nepalensis]
MELSTPVLLVGIGLRKAPNRPAVRVGRIAGLVAGPEGAGPLPPSALRLPEPLAFAGLPELRAWLVAREARLAAALHAIGGCRELGIELHEDAAGHAAWLRDGDEGLAGGAGAGPARAARRHLIGQRVEAILASAARAAVLPTPGAAPSSWTAAVPAAAVHRLRAALDLEARRLVGTGLSLRLGPPGGSGGLARAILQDA